jgi:hypothetical protein
MHECVGAVKDATGERPEGVDLVLNKPLTLTALREAVARVSAPDRRLLPT